MEIIERLQKELLDFYYEKLNELNKKRAFTLDYLSSREVTDEEKERIDLTIANDVRSFFEKSDEHQRKTGVPLPKEDFEELARKSVTRLINNQVDEENRKLKEMRNSYKREIEKVKKIIDLLKKRPIKTNEIYEILKQTTLTSSIKADYMKDISAYAEIKNKEYEEEKKRKEELKRQEEEKKKREEEEKVIEVKEEKIPNYEYVESVLQKYSDLILQNIDEIKLEGFFSESDIKQILEFYFVDLDDDIFNCTIETLLFNITQKTTEEEIQSVLKDIDTLCKKYELLTNLNELDNLIKDLYSRFNLSGDEVALLSTIQNEINKIKNNKFDENKVGEVIDETYAKIYNIRKQKFLKYVINNDDKLSTKAFVLFDYNKKTQMPYVLNDLNEKSPENQIDESIKREKIVSNGYNDFNDLIDDLILYGAPGITLQKNDKLNKIIRPVYYHENQYDIIKSSMKNSTGMFRIKPRLTSYVRFMDEKVVYAPNTPKMKQIKELLESRLPNISIDSSRSFMLFINYLDAFKVKELDSYSTSLKRKEISELQKILKTKEDKYTDEELYKIGKAIDMTLDAYQSLKEINSNFRFNTVDKLLDDTLTLKLD